MIKPTKKFAPKAILLDLDGTLIDSGPDLANAVNHALSHFDKAPFDKDIVHNWIGNGARQLVMRALQAASLNADELIEKALPIYHDYYLNHVCVDTYAYPEVINTLRDLKKQGFKLAIVTNKSERYVRPILDSLGFLDLFTFIVGGDTTEHLKPAPQPLLFAAEKINVSPNECVMVGDSKNDILAAQAANIESIAVTYGYNYGENINTYLPSAVIDSFSELKALVN